MRYRRWGICDRSFRECKRRKGGMKSMKKIPILFVFLILVLAALMLASSFRLNFTDAYLAYVPSSKTLQIAAHGKVLSYGTGWIVQQVQPYLYHMRLSTWQGFFWKINTSQKKVFKTTNGQFGTNVGHDTQMNVTLEVIGGSNNVPPTRFLIRFNTSQKKVFKTTNGQFGTNVGHDTQMNVTLEVIGGSNNVPPTRFLIRFHDAYLIYVIESQSIQIAAQSTVLSYANDWNKAQIYPYLFHIRLATWQGFYWQVNTSRKELVEIRNGTFGAIAGGTHSTLPISVTTQ